LFQPTEAKAKIAAVTLPKRCQSSEKAGRCSTGGRRKDVGFAGTWQVAWEDEEEGDGEGHSEHGANPTGNGIFDDMAGGGAPNRRFPLLYDVLPDLDEEAEIK